MKRIFSIFTGFVGNSTSTALGDRVLRALAATTVGKASQITILDQKSREENISINEQRFAEGTGRGFIETDRFALSTPAKISLN